MIMTQNSMPTNKHGDIVESELLEILEAVIDSRTGLSAIHQLLDEAKTMSDIRHRFNQWQRNQGADKKRNNTID